MSGAGDASHGYEGKNVFYVHLGVFSLLSTLC